MPRDRSFEGRSLKIINIRTQREASLAISAIREFLDWPFAESMGRKESEVFESNDLFFEIWRTKTMLVVERLEEDNV